MTPPTGSSSSMANLSLAVNQHVQGVTGDQTSPWTRAANTPNAMLGVGKTWATSVGQAATAWQNISAPATPGGPPPTAGQQTARVIRAVQQTAAAVMGALGLAKQALDVGFANLTAPIAAVFPSLPAATLMSPYIGTPHAHILHPPSGPNPIPIPAPIPMPSIGMSLLGNSVRVLINSMPAARVEDIGLAPTCCGIPPQWFKIKTGSSNVFIGGVRAARLGDICKECPMIPETPSISAGKVMGAIGKAAGVAASAMAVAGVVVGALGMAADIAEAAVEDSEAMASAKALAAAMTAAQMAMDASKMAVENLMWKDVPVVPPSGSIGAIVDPSHATVLIGGFPMVNIPDPVGMLLNRLSRYKAASSSENEGCGEEGEPVDVVTGANVDDNIDYETRTCIPFCWHRYYDSRYRDHDGPLGRGHRHEYQRQLRMDTDGLRYTDEKGRDTGFPPPEGTNPIAKDGLVLRRLDNLRYRIEADGKPSMEFLFADTATSAPLNRLEFPPHSIDFHYDSQQRLLALSCPRRWIIRLDYDDRNHVARLWVRQEPARREQVLASYTYDRAGNMVSWTDSLGHHASFEYDTQNRLTRKTDRRGYSYHYQYDPSGRCIHTYGEDGLYDVRFQYMPEASSTLVTFSDGGRWTYFYDSNGNIIRIIDPYGGSRVRNLDGRGRVVQDVGPSGKVNHLLYNAAGSHIGRRDHMGYVTAPLGEDPHPAYPLAHRLPATPLEWEFGHLIDQRRMAGRPIEKWMLDRLPGPVVQTVRKNAEGAASTGTPVRSYDLMGNLVEETLPGVGARRWDYDPNGNPIAYRDADGSIYRFQYTSWNLLSRAVDPMGHAVLYQYSPREKLTGVTDPRNVQTVYVYDLKDRMIEARRNTLREQYKYDLGDNLIEKVNADGKTLLSFEIEKPGLKSIRHLASGENHLFEYSETGRFVRAATDESEVVFGYGAQDRMLRDQRDGRGVVHSYADGKLEKTIYLGKFTTKYQLKRGAWIIEDPTGARHRILSAPSGLILREMSNRTSELCQYDAEGRCRFKGQWNRQNLASLRTSIYQYSAEGDLIRVEETANGTATYEYDAAHRLIRETLPGARNNFEYDASGNLLQQPGLSGVSVDDANRLIAANGERFIYDDRDNISQRQSSTGPIFYHYDSRGLLVLCERGGSEWRAQYDPLGRRIAKSWADDKVEFYWDRDRLAAEIHCDGRVRLYIYADSTALVPILFVDYGSLDSPPESGLKYFIFSNQIGAPVRIEDSEGQPVWSARISPYGRAEIRPGAAVELSLRFPGHYYDAETGLHYNRFRYYSPELGRYLQPDRIDITGGVNVFAYAASPLSQVDLNGLHPKQGSKNEGDEDDPEDGDDKYPGTRGKIPGCDPKPKTRSDENQEGYDKAQAALAKGHTDPDGVWDQNALANDPRLKSNLDKFANGDIGQSVKDLDLRGKTPEQIHDELIQNGFDHDRSGIAVPGTNPTQYKTYDPATGQTGTTTDPNDPNMVPQDMYTHPDGGLVRVKPEGDPGNNLRPSPQASKSVVDPPEDTRWANNPGDDGEQFKVDNDGNPIPRSPQSKHGMSQGPSDSSGADENKGWGDGAMDAGHTNLPPDGS